MRRCFVDGLLCYRQTVIWHSEECVAGSVHTIKTHRVNRTADPHVAHGANRVRSVVWERLVEDFGPWSLNRKASFKNRQSWVCLLSPQNASCLETKSVCSWAAPSAEGRFMNLRLPPRQKRKICRQKKNEKQKQIWKVVFLKRWQKEKKKKKQQQNSASNIPSFPEAF